MAQSYPILDQLHGGVYDSRTQFCCCKMVDGGVPFALLASILGVLLQSVAVQEDCRQTWEGKFNGSRGRRLMKQGG